MCVCVCVCVCVCEKAIWISNKLSMKRNCSEKFGITWLLLKMAKKNLSERIFKNGVKMKIGQLAVGNCHMRGTCCLRLRTKEASSRFKPRWIER